LTPISIQFPPSGEVQTKGRKVLQRRHKPQRKTRKRGRSSIVKGQRVPKKNPRPAENIRQTPQEKLMARVWDRFHQEGTSLFFLSKKEKWVQARIERGKKGKG